MTSRNDRIPELRIGKLDGLWTAAKYATFDEPPPRGWLARAIRRLHR